MGIAKGATSAQEPTQCTAGENQPGRVDPEPHEREEAREGQSDRQGIDQGRAADELTAPWAAQLEAFGTLRDRYLIYR